MNTYSPYNAVTESFTYPSPPTAGTASVTVYYDLGDVVVAATAPTLVSGNNYSITIPDDLMGAAGVYRIKWSCTISGTPFYAYTEFKIEDTYVSSSDFFTEFPDYDLPQYTSRFASVEKVARRIIDTYTGQDFQFIKNKTYKYDGNDRKTLYLGSRLNSFTSVLVDDTDYTSAVRLDFRSKYFLQTIYPAPSVEETNTEDIRAKVFPKNSTVYVTGDWGWLSVPWEIQQACSLLISDLLDDVKRENRRYGIKRIEQDSHRIEFDTSIFNSTGNIDVDTLLMDFVVWTMDYVT